MNQNGTLGLGLNAARFRNLPPVEYLRQRYRYCAETGRLYEKDGTVVVGGRSGRNLRYLRICIDGRDYPYHRVCFAIHNGVDPGILEIDHIDRNSANNRADNLRAVTRSVNLRNRTGWRNEAIRKLAVGETITAPLERWNACRQSAAYLKRTIGSVFKVSKVGAEIHVTRLGDCRMYAIETNIPLPPGKRAPWSHKYPWHQLEVGQSFFVPKANINSMRAGASRAGAHWQKKFVVRVMDGGVRIWRTA